MEGVREGEGGSGADSEATPTPLAPPTQPQPLYPYSHPMFSHQFPHIYIQLNIIIITEILLSG